MDDNANWLLDLNYVNFIREIGVLFSVNKMLTAECYKNRMEKGLSFFEFNYMIMQAYDFLMLYKKYGCTLQLGGNDQWSNIIAGADLIRRKEQAPAFGLTLELLTLPSGEKMGKTASGAIFLSPDKTKPYDFYQHFRNRADADVITLLKRLTFIPLEEIASYEKLEGEKLNPIKELLAYDLTERVHGHEAAEEARKNARNIFSGSRDEDSMPEFVIENWTEEGIELAEVMVDMKLVKTKSEARRLMDQNGISLNAAKVTDGFYKLSSEDFKEGSCVLQKGKKIFYKLSIK